MRHSSPVFTARFFALTSTLVGTLALGACADVDVASPIEDSASETDGGVYDENAQVYDLDADPERETLANWNIGANSPTNTSLSVWWDAQLGLTYDLCWKKTGSWSRTCKNKVSVTSTGANTWNGVMNAGIFGLECGTEYKVKVKLGLSSDSTTVTTAACGCSNPCPQGGYFDGANCQIGQAPAGTTAFIYANNYYYSALPGNSCPYPGSWFDGANCFVQDVPPGVTPFIWANHWYYQSCP